MKKILLLFLVASFCLRPQAQTVISNQNVDQFPVDASGTLEYGLTWLPASYASNPSKKYPLIVFLHGSGQAGSGLSALNGLSAHGIPQKIAAGFRPAAVNPKDGQTYEFIVVTPMDPNWAPTYNTLKYILPNILSRYHVDTTRIYVSGFSAGGGEAFGCLGSGDSTFIRKIAAIATSSSAGVDAVNGYTDVQVLAKLREGSKKYGAQAWAITGDQDGLSETSVDYIDSLNIPNPAIHNKLTVISGRDHLTTDALAYDTAFRPMLNSYGSSANCNNGCSSITAPNNNGSSLRGSGSTQDSLNVYEWLLLFTRSAAASTPTANAGSNQSIILPANSVTLSGSGTAGTGHTISSYGWTRVSGGTATITSPSSASTSVTGLVQGVYTFRLTVTNNVSATATSDVTITVNPAPVANAGSNQTITLPVSSVTLNGSASTGTITSYSWTRLSGGAATITTPSAVSTTVTGLAQGAYTFQLSLNNGASTATVNVTVNPASTSLIGYQHIDKFPIDAAGDSLFGLTWLPVSDTSSSSKKYPLILFLTAAARQGPARAG